MDIFIFLFLPPSENKNRGNKSKQPNVDFSGCFYTSFFIYLCFIIVLIVRFRYFQSIKYFLNEKEIIVNPTWEYIFILYFLDIFFL